MPGLKYEKNADQCPKIRKHKKRKRRKKNHFPFKKKSQKIKKKVIIVIKKKKRQLLLFFFKVMCWCIARQEKKIRSRPSNVHEKWE